MTGDHEDRQRLLDYLGTFTPQQALPDNASIANILAMPEALVAQAFEYLRESGLVRLRSDWASGKQERRVHMPQKADEPETAAPESPASSQRFPSVESRRKALAEPTGHAWWSVALT